ncbi:hypothetical protein ELE36_17170 [Pseudolysobacter antarcticus]|uniref:Uncharacterized protein n=1 Tax=Pseudolysobacter antarcticus TaxID=2511995 RepID=A0A411HNA6_9GAMM|nr:hypothetical protein [Pseudolysobacter antarcticus]QBB71952.1 hypothetical protein ELE36_17170 [Pseudolysobacter antarcticus]
MQFHAELIQRHHVIKRIIATARCGRRGMRRTLADEEGQRNKNQRIDRNEFWPCPRRLAFPRQHPTKQGCQSGMREQTPYRFTSTVGRFWRADKNVQGCDRDYQCSAPAGQRLFTRCTHEYSHVNGAAVAASRLHSKEIRVDDNHDPAQLPSPLSIKSTIRTELPHRPERGQ